LVSSSWTIASVGLAIVALVGRGALADVPALESPFARATRDLPSLRVVPGGLTPEWVAERAVASSFDVAGRSAALEGASAAVDEVRRSEIPTLTLLASYARLSPITLTNDNGPSVVVTTAPPGPLYSSSPVYAAATIPYQILLDQVVLQATLNVPLSDYILTFPDRVAAATKVHETAEWDLIAARAKVAMQAQVVFYDWVLARAQVDVAEEGLQLALAHTSDANALYTAGARARADVFQAEEAEAAARVALEERKERAAVAEMRLRSLLHDRPGTTYRVGVNLTDGVTPWPGSTDSGALEHEAFEHRAELHALEVEAAAQRLQSNVVRAAGYPRLRAYASGMEANPNPRYFPPTPEFLPTWEVGAVLSWTPTDVLATSARARGVEARGREIDAQLELLRDAIRVDVVQATEQARRAATVADMNEGRLVSSEAAYRGKRDLYQAGKVNATEVIDAGTKLTRARLDAIATMIDLRVALIRLRHATGRDVRMQLPS
jgi:outer membrane protein